MEEEVIKYDRKTSTAFSKQVAFSLNGNPGSSGTKPTLQGYKQDYSGGPWSPWGDNNLFPQDVVSLVSKSTVAPAALNFKIKSIYGRGLMTCNVIVNDDESETIKPVRIPEVDAFFKKNKISRYLLESITDFVWFFNVFPEVILSKDRKKITEISCNEATQSRWEKKSKEKSIIENCYFSANWDLDPQIDLVKVPVLSQYQTLEELKSRTDAWKYIVPVNYPTPGKDYYQLAYWDGARSNGWIEGANEIPQIIKAMMKFMVNWQWHVEISMEYWKYKYPEFYSLSIEKQDEIIDAELKRMNDWLTGSKNSGKTYVSFFDYDKVTQTEKPHVKITALENKYKEGAWLPTSAAANSEILFAMQVDPALMGAGTPGGTYEKNNGGSNKRESFLINTALLQTERDCILEPLYLIKDYNGWPENLEFRFRDTILTTLDTGAGTKKVVS